MVTLFNKKKASIKLWQLNAIISLLLVMLYNQPFWHELLQIVKADNFSAYLFLFSVFCLLALLFNLLLTLFCFKYSYKLVYLIIFLGSSSGLYFISQYNVLVNADMVQNVFETNSTEAFDFVNFKVFLYVLFMGLLPLLILFKIPVKFDRLAQSLRTKVLIVVISVVAIVALLFVSYPNYASIARNQRHLSHKILPSNYIFATVSYLQQRLKQHNVPVKPIAKDAKRGKIWEKVSNKTVLVLILGETARADHFSTNGYHVPTTPFMQHYVNQGKVLNYPSVSSCGTSTAVSLPCIFSHFVRQDYSKSEAKANENLLDFIKNAQIDVQWRDNNTGCKGLCARVNFQDFSRLKDKDFCNDAECFDEILLKDLAQQIKTNPNNQMIVLHQKGSHGPAYYLRYPKKFEKFAPTCNSNELQSCSVQEVVNAYDNTLLYTDYFIKQTLALLENLPKNTNTALLYVSDHGESLGENNIYLHGTPYFMAPDAQTHVPMLLWLSSQMQQQFAIDYACLQQKTSQSYSHDNYFHSVLGLLNVESSYYQSSLDLFAQCRVEN